MIITYLQLKMAGFNITQNTYSTKRMKSNRLISDKLIMKKLKNQINLKKKIIKQVIFIMILYSSMQLLLRKTTIHQSVIWNIHKTFMNKLQKILVLKMKTFSTETYTNQTAKNTITDTVKVIRIQVQKKLKLQLVIVHISIKIRVI